jgi:hypothetical protein
LPHNLEKHFVYDRRGIRYQGYIDFVVESDSGPTIIGDHKTSSNIKRYALNEKTILENVQATLYADWAFSQFDAPIMLQWIYYATKGKPRAHCVKIEIKNKNTIQNTLDQIDSTAQNLHNAHAKQFTAKHLKPNYKSCFKYGRCEYWDNCKKRASIRIVVPHNVGMPQKERTAFTLYIDCIPVKSGHKKLWHLAELLRPIKEQIQKNENLAHYRMARFGQHVPLLQVAIKEFLNTQNFDSSVAICTTLKSPEGTDSIGVLQEMAGEIIQGL